jgi:Flp pilus assembly protein TadG
MIKSGRFLPLGQGGNALLEFSYILPIFVILLSGTINYGFSLYDSRILTQASFVGSSTAAAMPSGTDWATVANNATEAINAFLRNSGANPASFSIKIENVPIDLPNEEKLVADDGSTTTVDKVFAARVSVRRIGQRNNFFSNLTVQTVCGKSMSVLAVENQIQSRGESLPDCP